ncbi:MAG: bifunctional UDP-3-O-[3-hydroxymyristoyl] N-acetylglucosamine deacetylase/3-hydroxyacyl-ACP dehydratase [Candidatus Marinimicrobia bacterium]|nr:bifunctional UDP-3-O-[3-hydroxymyristoyl] N-acetylglucosamine deacetylase/3-hydroxyacyl-ACP dehydratase [Candidatus Neomarinimicrobiota bacterium]MCF7829229.1 bifunctional UDP-3-O-[3-hydroxymyristoyl] N-acetylglucosamine deacetylase/3-hydroxyacyl-ACP dehydratase [Candidatus Neomarinimicrobiota bacterium]MCF7881118.1 bifunctional UDP-3-O-[3-hydroxymyristoyl] N-acetylglucosamine deacetylase/3-hydroxyacyl-ACP dehydratase [Candidatus Neomarinimicrobiota bacterium]
MKKQRTIQKPISIEGYGLHTGEPCKMTFRPAEVNTGFQFRRLDLEEAPAIQADIEHVVDISRGTTIQANGAKVHTVEHVLSALAGLQLDNVMVDLNGPEPPVMDGSAKPYVDALLEVGFREQDEERQELQIDKTITYSDPDREVDIHLLPSDRLRVTFMIDYKNPTLGTQYTALYSLEDEYADEFAEARTFCFLHEVEDLKEQGLIKGGNVENAVVIVDREIEKSEFDRLKRLFKIEDDITLGTNGILDSKELRFYNEPARHKVVDLIGDMALLGMPIKGHIIAARSGHAANVELVKKIKKEYERQLIREKYQSEQQDDSQYFFDVRAISKILPHRYPFLLVDRILDLEPQKRVTAIKNVTINEHFFQGHFPGKPIMPGVLVLEAMGQAGGILLLNTVDNPENKLVYFTGIDNVKFRKTIVPGDQIRLELELLKYRLSICKMRGKAYVNGQVVAEAELSASVVEQDD